MGWPAKMQGDETTAIIDGLKKINSIEDRFLRLATLLTRGMDARAGFGVSLGQGSAGRNAR
jgi:hypothetical protein